MPPAGVSIALPVRKRSQSSKLKITTQNARKPATKRRRVAINPNVAVSTDRETLQNADCLSPSKSPQFFENSLRLADQSVSDSKNRIGPYHILGKIGPAESSYHALDTRTNQLLTCQVLSDSQLAHFYQLSARLDSLKPHQWPCPGDRGRIRDRIIPRGTALVDGPGGRHYLFSPRTFGSLHGFVQRNGRVAEQTCRALFAQIVELVALCHALGIVLRDLKLRKFAFSDDAQTEVCLSDIGNLVICDSPSDDGLTDRQGCPAYVSPEMLNLGSKSYGGRAADVWSAGVMLYVMALGRYPFYDRTPAGLFGKIRRARLNLNAEGALSLELRHLLACLLRAQPADRPTAFDILAVPWLSRSHNGGSAWGNWTGESFRTATRSDTQTQEKDQLVPCLTAEQLSAASG